MDRLKYRFLTGADDRAFCEKVSKALDEGYVLYGEPKLAVDDDRVVCGQAVIWPESNDREPPGIRRA